MHESRHDRRAATMAALGTGRFDVAVVGGGIIGLATAWEAARAGYRVALVERGDFACATSSASSKLAHGGLRYLAMGNIRLVRENHRERQALGRLVAPHHVRPLPFLVALRRGGPHGRAAIGAGMLAYTALSGFRDGIGRLVSPATAREYVPALRADGLTGCGFYHDHQMNDARLAVTTAMAAAQAGAVLLNHAEVTGLRTTRGRVSGVDVRDRLSGAEFGVDARVVVNATGPWVDHLRRMEDPAAAPSVRLSKGAHLVLRRRAPWHAAVTTPVDDVRVSFALPWEGRLLLGTTDEPYEGDPAEVGVTAGDTEQILGEAALAIEPDHLRREDVLYSFAGLRVLPGGDQDTSHARRETVISLGSRGMVSIAGGKWTTFRHIGRTVLGRLRGLLPERASVPGAVPLPGAGEPAAIGHVVSATLPDLPADVVEHLVRQYGTQSHELLGLGLRDAALLERVHPEGPDIWAQVAYAADREWAVSADDVLRRRTTLTVRGLDTPEIRARVESLLATPART
ncbi:glycerol-3-phosphate dehydrogenase [Prauserella shujinwangii]|uniref:Glycerol-3-phosphate dehydrogenase n=1 Tax=Prauserella shujinwangii TaxID=1453103 RepID=A0A2T0LR29_9PSEU|nr:glycerol-3-phosphate dehydrogenase/oxidase [Prauserella shujinwangii]PRX45922.1 glycerol-3-phosphate dehydrogenase [Prauserella shujinwangii]